MERKFYTNDFERLLKEKSDEFRMYPSKRVWHSIYNNLHPSRKWPSVAMMMMLVIGLLLIGYFNTSDNTSKSNIADNLALQTGVNKNTGTDQTNKANSVSLNNKQGESDLSSSADESNPTSSISNINGSSSANTVLPDNQDNSFTQAANNTSTTSQVNNPNAYNNSTLTNNKNVIEAMDSYINTNQLLADVAMLNKQSDKTKPVNGVDNSMRSAETVISYPTETNKVAPQNFITSISPANLSVKADQKTEKLTETPAKKAGLSFTDNKLNPNDEKSWMEDYVLHNKSARQKWKDHLELEIYATPSIGYRRLENNAKPEATVTSFSANQQPARDLNKSVSQKPGLGLEAGVGLSYSFAKKFRLKIGAQLNYTSYTINADETNHPVLTTLLLNDINTNNAYLTSRTSTHSNSSGLDPVKLRNKTYQVSIPVGLAVKLAGNNKLEWYVGVSVQPTYVMGGKANLISSDYQNYVTEPSMLSKWNLNTGVETYINYKMGSYSLQVGPQLRYQVLSTYNKKYTIKENLYNAGLKIGIVKGF